MSANVLGIITYRINIQYILFYIRILILNMIAPASILPTARVSASDISKKKSTCVAPSLLRKNRKHFRYKNIQYNICKIIYKYLQA